MTNVIEGRIKIKDDGTLVLEKFGATTKREMGKAGKASKKAADESDSAWKKAKGTWIAAAAAAAGLTIAVGKIAKFSKEAVLASEEQRKSVAGMEAAMRSMGRYTPTLSSEMQDLASSLQTMTNFGDEATLQGMKFMMTYGAITNDLLPRSTKAMQDLGALMGGGPGGLVRAANMLGKASMGMTGELRRVGITVDSATFESEGYLGVLKQIEKQVSGQALAMVDPWTQMSNAVGDATENVGGLISIAFRPFAEDMIALLGETTESWQTLHERITETRAVMVRAKLNELQELLGGTFTAGGSMPEITFDIATDVSEEERQKIQQKIDALNEVLEQLEPSSAGAGGAGPASDILFGTGAQEATLAVFGDTLNKMSAQAADWRQRERETAITWQEEDSLLLQEQLLEQNAATMQAWSSQSASWRKFDRDNLVKHNQATSKAEKDAARKKLKLHLTVAQQQVNLMSQTFLALSTLGGKHSKTMFRLYQGMAIAEATISGIKATVEAYAQGMKYGMPAAIAFATISAAFAAAQIAAIASQSPGGGAVGTAAVGAGAAAAVPGATSEREDFSQLDQDEERGQATIIIQGDVLADEYYIERLAELISGMVEDRDVRLVASETREF